MVNQKFSPSKDDPAWGGWTRDPQILPLSKIERDGYELEQKEDKFGVYWEIVKIRRKINP